MIRRRRIVIGIIACLFGVLILMLAAILLAPKLIDSEAVKAKVRNEIRETAGVEIDFKHLALDFLPHPHVVFEQVTLSIPPGVRAKAVSVRVHPKIFPLFQGKIQIASLRLDSAELDYKFTKKPPTEKITSQPFSPHELGKKIQSIVSTLREYGIPNLDFRVNNAKVNLFDGDRKFLELTSVNFHLDGPLDSTWKMSGTHERYSNGLDNDIRLTFEGRMGSKSIQWLSNTLHVPHQIHIRPLTLSTSHLTYSTNKNGGERLSASLALQDGLKISADILLGSGKMVIKKLSIRDKSSRATMGISLHNKILTSSFKGNLHKATLDQLVSDNPWLGGWLDGDFRTHVDMKNPLKFAAWGELKGKEIIYPWKAESPLTINDFAVTATKHKINLTSADVTFGGNRLHAAGNMMRSAQNVLFDMDITADTVELDHLIQAVKNSSENNGAKTAPSLPVKGSIRFKTDRLRIGEFTWSPLHADISLNRDTADVTVKKAVLCGISTPGTIKVSPTNVEFDLEAVAKDQELDLVQRCLVGENFKADGTYNLKGRFQGRGKAEDLLKTATGQVEFTAANGRIYHDIILVDVLRFLNTLEVLTGRVDLKDMGRKGFGYHSFRVRARLHDGKVMFEEVILHGAPMTVTAAGEHDLQNGRVDLNLLVSPLVTLDRVFEHIPLIGGMPDTLDTIPLSAKGTLDNIHIYPLAPSAVGYELEEMMKNAVERPINFINGGKTPEQN